MKKRTITYDLYLDKVLGGWIGKSLGGTIGAPVEAHKIKGNFTEDNCWPSTIYPNDDLDIQVVWLEMLEEVGCDYTSMDLVHFWQDRCWYNFAEYGMFLNNVQRGIQPPLSGEFNNSMYNECMGCPIRSEIWSLVSPGNVRLAAMLAKLDGELDHIKNSVYSEQFWAACGAEAFFESDLDKIFEAGKSAIPKESDIYRITNEVKALWEEFGDWNKIWLKLIRKYGNRDGSKCEINFAFTLLSLYVGKGDFKRTIVTAINCGWDTDCTAATAGALLGIMYGSCNLPQDWKNNIGDSLTCDVNVRHKTALLRDLAIDTCKIGIEMSFLKNTIIEILDIPQEIYEQVLSNFENRPSKPLISFQTIYNDPPVLFSQKQTKVSLHIQCTKIEESTATLTIHSPDAIIFTPNQLEITLKPNQSIVLNFSVNINDKAKILYDKNIFEAVLTTQDNTSYSHQFGLVGARQWQVYGPYWDGWNKKKHGDICPFRNESVMTHPCFQECGEVLVHNFVQINREYLDEKLLLTQDIVSEEPYLVERGEDYIDETHLGGFFGEAVYYLIRNLVSSKDVDCIVGFGTSVPFVAYVDGEEIFRFTENYTWGISDIQIGIRLTTQPKRLVIKLLKNSDQFKFGMGFFKIDVAGNKTIGHSYLIDLSGDLL